MMFKVTFCSRLFTSLFPFVKHRQLQTPFLHVETSFSGFGAVVEERHARSAKKFRMVQILICSRRSVSPLLHSLQVANYSTRRLQKPPVVGRVWIVLLYRVYIGRIRFKQLGWLQSYDLMFNDVDVYALNSFSMLFDFRFVQCGVLSMFRMESFWS